MSSETLGPDTLRQHLLTINEVADVMRAPVATLRYWRHAGIGPRSFRIGRRVLYYRSDVDAWIAAQHDQTDLGRRDVPRG